MSRALCLTLLWQTSCYWSRTCREKHRMENKSYWLKAKNDRRHRARADGNHHAQQWSLKHADSVVCVKKCQGPCVWRCCGRHRVTGRGPAKNNIELKNKIYWLKAKNDRRHRANGNHHPKTVKSQARWLGVCQEMSRALCLTMLWQTSCYWSRTYKEKHRIEGQNILIESQEWQATSC